MPRRLHRNLFIRPRGHHETAWDHPGADPRSLMDISYYVDLAKQAEAAKLDSIFFADVLIRHGGTITHQHAVGRDHQKWYEQQRPALFGDVLADAKKRLDPKGMLNPGVVVGKTP